MIPIPYLSLSRYCSNQENRPSVTPTHICPQCYLCLTSKSILDPHIPKYPCGACGRAVCNKQAAVSCDACDQWFHIKCQGMSQQTYNHNIVADFSWTCTACTLSNIQVTLLNHTTSPTSAKSDPGSPLAHSSPTRRNNHYRCNKRKLTLININCQSITNKKGDLQSLIDTHTPDIICATETWLSKNHRDGEIWLRPTKSGPVGLKQLTFHTFHHVQYNGCFKHMNYRLSMSNKPCHTIFFSLRMVALQSWVLRVTKSSRFLRYPQDTSHFLCFYHVQSNTYNLL